MHPRENVCELGHPLHDTVLTHFRLGLIQTATAEHEVARYAAQAVTSKKLTAPSNSIGLGGLIQSLLSTIASEPKSSEDVFQTQTCLAWLHWSLSEPDVAITTFPKDPAMVLRDMAGGGQTTSQWSEICLIKAAYIMGTSHLQASRRLEALATFVSVTPWMYDNKAKILSQVQLSYWSQSLLAQLALAARYCQQSELALQAFRHWAVYSAMNREYAVASFGDVYKQTSKVQVWQDYYQLLSRDLQHTAYSNHLGDSSQHLQQVAEFRRIESIYENELLRTTRFPRAQEASTLIEDWVEQVISNWEILCGPGWHDEDLGEGGRNGVGRSVLDMLYRAAAKTFHSTLILRRLFQVHKSLAEFDLAYKALKSYNELIDRGRARAEKSNGSPIGQDDDETVLRTISEGIVGLCSFGTREEAEHAYELSTKLEEWLDRLLPVPLGMHEVNGNLDGTAMRSKISTETFATTYRAIGVGQSQWAKWTPYSENRTSLQNQAISNLKRSIGQESDAPHEIESIYGLGLMLAETREINGAIELVKDALGSNSSSARQDTYYADERKRVPLWHLLALLLSAKQDFDTSRQTCAAAFEQFPSAEVLFGHGPSQDSIQGTNQKDLIATKVSKGLVDDMETRELERIIEIRMTELALTEVVEGPQEAVNNSNELLSLFFRLFGHLGVATEDTPRTRKSDAPQSLPGTVKSFRGSLFGRRKPARPLARDLEKTNGVASNLDDELARQSSQKTEAPTIHVTDEHDHAQISQSLPHFFDNSSGRKHQAHKRHGHDGSIKRLLHHHHNKDRHSRERNTHPSSHMRSLETGREAQEKDPVSNSMHHGPPNGTRLSSEQVVNNISTSPPSNDGHDSSPQAKQEIPPIPRSTPRTEPPPSMGHGDQPPHQDVRLPNINSNTSTTQPVSRFPRAGSQKHALAILTKMWLLIACLYRRASMYEDSREACEEAAKAAMRIETIVANTDSSAAAFAAPGWGDGKSSDEIWADVFCERGQLALVRSGTFAAIEHLEQALMYWPNHPGATIALSNVLLDMYEQKMTSEKSSKTMEEPVRKPGYSTHIASAKASTLNGSVVGDGPMATKQAEEDLRKTPENLNRLAARDRAYGLLSSLTKLGSSWDDSEAWFALARAHECSGQIEKAKEVLWYCVELEDTRPVRHWRNLGSGGCVI